LEPVCIWDWEEHMRRSEREIVDRKEIDRILQECTVCRLALNDRPFPYVLPLHYAYTSGRLYIHSATAGRKIDLISADNHVCFEVDRVADVIEAGRACDWCTRYESVVGTGMAVLVTDHDEKEMALRELMRKYSGSSDWTFPREMVDRLVVIRIDIESLTGKSSL
jgi:nitroimidazol reductase NimA-like FMN-containing flavoprotein (pyridoxamine 5'-phosphate oxidase superfamily)